MDTGYRIAKYGTQETIPLRDHIEAILVEKDKRYDARFVAQGDAIDKATSALDSKLHDLNDLRGDMSPKSELRALEQRVLDLTDRFNKTEGRSGGINWTVGLGIAIGTLAAALIGVYFRAHA